MKNKTIRYLISFMILFLLLIISIVINICFGSIHFSLNEIMEVFINKSDNSTLKNILFEIRIPRTLTATILGGSLAVSGFLLQTFFNNPIASPFVLGVSSGAKFCVALTMIISLNNGIVLNSISLVISSFIGSIISMGFVLIISQKTNNQSTLIICGVMIGYICSAITDFIVTFADDYNIVNLHNWSMGSFSGSNNYDVIIMSIFVFSSVIVSFGISKQIGAYQMGESYAQNMGINIKNLKISIILISSVLSACVTAFAGPISFVGIAVPHLIKNLFNTTKPILIIPASFLGGSIFCLICDLIARTLFAPTELSISSVTAIFGVPIVLWIMLNKNKSK